MNRWVVTKAPGTHVLMDGGILNVPHEEMHLFREAYIAELGLGKRLHVVEQKTETFRFFVDLDYQGPTALTPGNITDICNVIHGDVVKVGRCLIAVAPPRDLAPGIIKSGVHVYWPDLHVTRQAALALRTRILVRLEDDTSRDWSKIIDASVYGGSGLRMIWSHKKPTGDPYRPWCVLDGQVFGHEPSTEVLELFSVRLPGGHVEPRATCPTSLLEAFIRKNVAGHANTCIRQIVRQNADTWYAQTDSHFCQRIQTTHKSNHAWFCIRKGELHPRCFDEDCREFTGRKHDLSPSVVQQLLDVAPLDPSRVDPRMDFLPEGRGHGPPSKIRRVRKPGPPVLRP